MHLEYRSDEGRHYCDYTGTQYPTGDPKSENNRMVKGGTEEWRNSGETPEIPRATRRNGPEFPKKF